MTPRIEALKQYFVLDKAHHAVRVPAPGAEGAPYRDAALPAHRRSALRLKAALEAETPVIFPEERIVATRTRPALPGIFTEEEWRGIESRHFIHERGYVSNLSPDYERILQEGLIAQRARLQNGEYGDSVRMTIDAVLDFARRYREEALRQGQTDIAARLERVPAYGARTFPEALQSLRILHYAMWCEGEYHNTLGRFDQYMYPYFQRDRESGALAPEEALEWLEEFFLSLNRDSDLYPGMQQGDNGQSMVLGGTARGGGEGFNPLSEACLAASRELGVIDPKINLRVNRDTPISTYLLGTRLTRRGLGFPQYENDDVVIPGLIGLGYAPEDAQNYVVAACWEFIIPGKGADIPNIGALPFASIVNRVLRETLPSASGMEEILAAVRAEIFAEARRMVSAIRDIYMIPAPYLSLFFENCVERSRDISLGCVYNNFGFHGTGLARRWIRWPRWSRRCLPKGSRRRNFCAPWMPILPVRTRCAIIWRTNARSSATMTAAPTGSPASYSPILPTRCADSQTSGTAASGQARDRPCTTSRTRRRWAPPRTAAARKRPCPPTTRLPWG